MSNPCGEHASVTPLPTSPVNLTARELNMIAYARAHDLTFDDVVSAVELWRTLQASTEHSMATRMAFVEANRDLPPDILRYVLRGNFPQTDATSVGIGPEPDFLQRQRKQMERLHEMGWSATPLVETFAYIDGLKMAARVAVTA